MTGFGNFKDPCCLLSVAGADVETFGQPEMRSRFAGKGHSGRYNEKAA